MDPHLRLLPARREGMTLTELLVVVGIIAVLVGIVVTGSLSIRRRVDLVRCHANLMQLGVAVSMYISDHGTLPLVHYANSSPEGHQLRPPSPPPEHDIAVALADHISDPSLFECPATHRVRANWGYEYNDWDSGLRPSLLRTPKHRALIICDRIYIETRRAHGGKLNALFLDGHVKAYPWIRRFPLRMLNDDGSGLWPPD